MSICLTDFCDIILSKKTKLCYLLVGQFSKKMFFVIFHTDKNVSETIFGTQFFFDWLNNQEHRLKKMVSHFIVLLLHGGFRPIGKGSRPYSQVVYGDDGHILYGQVMMWLKIKHTKHKLRNGRTILYPKHMIIIKLSLFINEN